ncbi:MAG TPA: hypothetical protein VNS02_04030 [Rhizobiaceae bacterium]|nr:hypothetical protein [Rhizobiaceae bacterium]
MSDDRTARPVSGEIMSTAPAGNANRHHRADDVVDARFETVAPQPAPAARSQPAFDAPPPGLGILHGTRPTQPQRGGPLFWTVGLALVAGAFWISGGHALFAPSGQPEQARPVSAQPMRIVDVTSRIETNGGQMALMVEGAVRNEGATPGALPTLSIHVTATDGAVTRYFLGTGGRTLQPGDRYPFSSRLVAPKDGVGTVTVDFRQEGEN